MLGAGGFGVTYLAFDHLLDGPVALKEYFPTDAATRVDGATVKAPSASREVFAWGFDRFMAEARAIHRFRHPNVVRAHRYLVANGTAYIVMEYVEGESLKAILDRRGTLPADEWRPWLEALMDGLAHVHGHGYLHRDIKPANIVVRAGDGEAVLIDFGSARVQHRDRTHTQVLTAGYAPIEQYSTGATQGPSADIYALAAVSYRVLTGDVVPSAPDRVLRDDYGPLTERIAGADRQWLAAIDRGLALRPGERPRDVAQWRCGLNATAGRDAPPVVAGGDPAEGASVAQARAEAGLENQSLQVGGLGVMALHRACESGPLEEVAALLDRGADPMAKDDDGKTPLHRAAENGNPEVPALLIDRGADVLAKDGGGRTPLHWAAENGNPEVPALLIDRGADPMAKDDDGNTPLHWAAHYENPEAAALLLDRGADLMAKADDGMTPLHQAALHGNPDVAALLLDRGADPMAKDEDGKTPLHWVTINENLDVAILLLKRGAHPMARDVYFDTPLHMAADWGNSELAALLLDHGADPMGIVVMGTVVNSTPLHTAVRNENPEVAAVLLNRGADPMAKDDIGLTPLDLAAYFGNLELAALLLDRGADPMAKDDMSLPPLHWATREENPEVAALLLDRGADPMAKDITGSTHLHWAAYYGNPKAAGLLLDHGADPMAKDDEGATPLHLAVREENPEAATLLLDCGADVLAKDRDGETPWKLAQNSLRSTEVYRRMSDLTGAKA